MAASDQYTTEFDRQAQHSLLRMLRQSLRRHSGGRQKDEKHQHVRQGENPSPRAPSGCEGETAEDPGARKDAILSENGEMFNSFLTFCVL